MSRLFYSQSYKEINMRTYDYVLLGKPMACPRPRATRQGRIYMPKEYTAHKKAITEDLTRQFLLQNHTQITEAAHIEIVFVYPRPKSLKGDGLQIKTTKPDLDNIIKTILDAITGAKIWRDDNLVTSINAIKYYGPKGFKGQTEIVIKFPWVGDHE